MSCISENIQQILKSIPDNVKLVAVSKTHAPEKIQEAYDGGYKVFGESRPQELREKEAILPKDIEWHMIGNLQKNKVKYIAPYVAMIHSVDSLSLLKVVEKEGRKNDRIISFLLQIKVAEEETKSGLSLEETKELLQSDTYKEMQHVRCCGIMGMATLTDNQQQIHDEFARLKEYFTQIKKEFFDSADEFKEISMGMSGDYPIAIKEGSTMIRVGSKIFGKR
ncbi:hypothetical protein C7377_1612 [Balneicella halophila]|uniref:Pyridoxal phosphate homeostasis protein n=1 Tax=Balneicella halophila TaxID=1537566 RepID=A0A7L4UMW9_BALHA|nr:YggS family pyridoxal phosphate-dependent enzyme [Balneicella halophila]PVX49971.1 hypothetical protein C7377_1612 [Balneicella halophila]